MEGLPPFVDYIVNFGVLGIVAVLLLTGHLCTGSERKRLEAENERLKSLIDSKDEIILDQSKAYTDKVIPTVERTIAYLDRGRS